MVVILVVIVVVTAAEVKIFTHVSTQHAASHKIIIIFLSRDFCKRTGKTCAVSVSDGGAARRFAICNLSSRLTG